MYVLSYGPTVKYLADFKKSLTFLLFFIFYVINKIMFDEKRRRLEQWALYEEHNISLVRSEDIAVVNDEVVQCFISDVENYLEDPGAYAPSIANQPKMEWEVETEDVLPSLTNFSAYRKWFGKLMDYSVWGELRDLLKDARSEDNAEE